MPHCLRPASILTAVVLSIAIPLASADPQERAFVTSSRRVLGTEDNRSASIRMGDVDQDGDLDVVVANGRHWPEQNFVFFNQGRAKFNLAHRLGQALAASYATELADLNGDDYLDVAVGNDRAPNAIFLNDRHGNFEHHGTFGEPASIRSLTLADIDQDGHVDILANARGNQNLIYLNDGHARFPISLPFGEPDDSTLAVAVADLDHDGHYDLILANRDAQPNAVLINDGHTRFEERLQFGTGEDETRAVAVADFNKDGHIDWVVGNIGQSNALYLNDGAGRVGEVINLGLSDGGTYAIAISDLNNDTHPDIAAANIGQANEVYFNQGDGQRFTEERFGNDTDITYNLAVGDLNQDGFDDIAVANSGGQNLIYLNVPSGGSRPRSSPRDPGPKKVSLLTAEGLLVEGALAEEPAQDWPIFRGPGGTGVQEGYPLPESWNATSQAEESATAEDSATTGDSVETPSSMEKNVLWRTSAPGLGHSSPVVWGDRLFLCTAIADNGQAQLMLGRGGKPTAADETGAQSWVVLCYDKNTGEELWRQTAHKGAPRADRHVKATQANTSLATDGRRLVAFFGSEGLYCYDLDGNLLWKRDLGVVNVSKYGIGWGYASSPAIHGDRVALVCDDPDNPYLVVLRLTDGEEIWRVSRQGVSERSWGTPLIHEGEGATQVVVNGWPYIVAYDLETSEELWRIHDGGDNPIPTPFVANGWIYITSAHGKISPIYVVHPGARGDITPATPSAEIEAGDGGLVWSALRGGSYMSTPVVYRGYVYLGSSNIVRCFNALTGERVYQKRLEAGASIIASLVAGDGKIYYTSEDGVVYVVPAGPEFEVIAANPVGEPCFATPAISEGVLYFRTTRSVIAIKE